MLLFTINNEDQQFTITKLVTSVLTFLVRDCHSLEIAAYW